ncbi:hypothetical protein C8R46DRAFT_1232344 [Mycena filopes]|nr:hypothetical protein C8R46DRAFT_1232344 [Mycena filopes]
MVLPKKSTSVTLESTVWLGLPPTAKHGTSAPAADTPVLSAHAQAHLPRLPAAPAGNASMAPISIDVDAIEQSNAVLSLRLARPIKDGPYRYVGFLPDLLADIPDIYSYPTHRHLPLLIPAISHCRNLEMVRAHIPDSMHSPATLDRTDTCHAAWLSALMRGAVELTHLHWDGPQVTVPWGQLSHLSWQVREFDRPTFEETLDLISGHVLPNVHIFSSIYDSSLTRYLVLPNLTDLILEWLDVADPTNLPLLIERSGCALQSLELWNHIQFRHLGLEPSFLRIRGMKSLTRLLLSSSNLDKFWLVLEQESPGTIHPLLLLLCRVDSLPDLADDETSGTLLTVLHTNFPQLERLVLNDHVGRTEVLESHLVTTFSPAVEVSRSPYLCQQYTKWWGSTDGQEFQAAWVSEGRQALQSFHIDFDNIDPSLHRSAPRRYPNPNPYANVVRTQY